MIDTMQSYFQPPDARGFPKNRHIGNARFSRVCCTIRVLSYLFISLLNCLPPTPALATDAAQESMEPSPDRVLAQCRQVANWQLREFGGQAEGNWVNAVALIGFVELYHIWHDFEYEAAIVELGRRNHWDFVQPPHQHRILKLLGLSPKPQAPADPNGYRIDLNAGQPFFADDHAHGQYAVELYWHLRDPVMVNPILQRIQYVLAHPPTTPLSQDKKENRARWNWSDALFMDPPLYARLGALTGDPRFFDFLDREFAASTEYLWSNEYDLIFRDDRFSQGRKSGPNGLPIFWGRGNAWLYAGITRVLEVYPRDRPARAMYLNYFRKLTRSLTPLRLGNGLWGPDLLDSSRYKYPDTSASALILYALAWGINHGILKNERDRQTLISGWKALQSFVSDQGELSGVQPSDYQPRCFDQLNSEAFGSGAYLLACSQIVQVLKGKAVDKRALSAGARLHSMATTGKR